MTFKQGLNPAGAMTYVNATTIPQGWNYDAINSCYLGPDGEIISEMDILQYGSLKNAIFAKYPAPTQLGNLNSIPNMGMATITSASSISNATNHANTMVLETDYGRVTLNIKTGDLTLPVGMAKEDGVKEFWMAFQKHFACVDTTEYERKIRDLKEEVTKKEKYIEYVLETVTENIANKIADKYNGRDLLMIKTKDLVNEIKAMK